MGEWLDQVANRFPSGQRWIRLVAQIPATIHAKLLVSFLIIVGLLIAVGAAGLGVLSGVNRRSGDLVKLQRKIAAYRQLQHDTTSQLYSVSTALLVPDERTLEATLRQLNQFGYDLDRLQFVAQDEVEVLAEIRETYDQFVDVVTRVIELIRVGHVTEGRELQLAQARPLADRLERLTNQLVNRAEADIVSGIEVSRQAYVASRWTVIMFAVGSIALALFLGYVISWSVIGPVKQMDAQLRRIGSGDFSQRVEVSNRDELGALAANLNRMNTELGRLYRQLEAASHHKSQFLANMSHELRTPMNAILGFTELIVDGVYGEAPAQIREILQRVQHSGRHLLGLINDVLDLSKIEAGQITLVMQPYSLPEIVQAAVSSVHSLATEKRLTLSVEIAPNLPHGSGDPRRLTQVLLNLVGNAIKFTEAGKVHVRAGTNDGRFTVTVADTGPGIPADEQGRIFEEFQQVDAPGGGKGGTGLGLTIARRIVELHGGRMGVDSQVGKGATFWFEVPVLADRRAEPP